MGSNGAQDLLKWKDFHSTFANNFKDLRDEDEFLDVTLACSEEQQIQAHKVILSVCSPYFKAMLLKQRAALHPVLIMPDNVRFEDVVSLLDFMYHGEVSVRTEDLNIFLNTAKQFKVKGLVQDEAPRMRPMNRPTFAAGMKHPRPQMAPHHGQQPPVPPDIRQRLPPGIQMVKRPAWEHSPEKRPRLHPGAQPRHYVEEDEEDDITEIRDSEADDYYEDYPEYDEGGAGFEDEAGMQQPQHQQATTAAANQSQMVGLLCPNCRTMCKGVAALKEHLQVCKGGQQPSNSKTPPQATSSAPIREPEEPQECHICDKSFKSHRTLDNHMKKQHGLAAPPRTVNVKGRGRPKKGPMSSGGMGPGDWSGDGGYESQSLQEPAAAAVATPHQRGRPVGQVAPLAPVRPGDSQTPSRASQPSTSATGDRSSGHNVRGRGRGMGPMGRGQMRRPGEDKPDLQKLGMKFGGQISITSSNNQGGAGGKKGQDGQGVSVMKMKGDVQVGAAVSIKDAKPESSSSSAPKPSAGESSKADTNNSDDTPRVKEEPSEEQDPEVAENFDDYGDGDYGDGADEEYHDTDMYGDDPDFTGENVDGDGMEVDLYNQYKNRGDDYDEDEAPLDDEYEEEV